MRRRGRSRNRPSRLCSSPIPGAPRSRWPKTWKRRPA